MVWKIENSYALSSNNLVNFVPLLSAPEWILNNFYLLDLGENLLLWFDTGKQDADGNIIFENKTFSHLTPERLLKMYTEDGFLKPEEQGWRFFVQGFDNFTDEEGTPVEGFNAMIYSE